MAVWSPKLNEKAIFVTDLLDAEAHYNDIAAELYECNEFYGNTTG